MRKLHTRVIQQEYRPQQLLKIIFHPSPKKSIIRVLRILYVLSLHSV